MNTEKMAQEPEGLHTSGERSAVARGIPKLASVLVQHWPQSGDSTRGGVVSTLETGRDDGIIHQTAISQVPSRLRLGARNGLKTSTRFRNSDRA